MSQKRIDGGGCDPIAYVVNANFDEVYQSLATISNSNLEAYRLQAFNADYGDWLILDGRELSRTTYSELFALIGTTFGVGDGSTTFNIPPSPSGRAIGVAGSGAGLTPRALGDVVGAETHKLTVAEMPAHTHNVETVQTASQNAWAGGDVRANSTTRATTSTGGDGYHNNMQPTAFLGYMAICVK